MFSRFDNDAFEDGFIYPSFQYNLQTPHRLRAGGTFILGKAGFITAEAERVQFGNARLSRPSEGSFETENGEISEFNDIWNFRGGAEIRLAFLRLRAGIAIFDDPTNDGIANANTQISGGIGVRTKSFFADLSAVTGINQQNVILPYPSASAAQVSTDINRLSLTIGMIF
jgi:hypothetical protein